MNTTATAPAAAPKTVGVQARSNLREYGLMIALVVIMVLFQVLTARHFVQTAEPYESGSPKQLHRHHGAGYAAGDCCGPHRPFGGFGGRLYWSACRSFDGATWACISCQRRFVCLIAGGAIGAAQGYWIAYLKIPSFIVTLAGMLVFRGLTLALLAGESIGPFPKQFQLLSSGFIPDFLALGRLSPYLAGDRRAGRCGNVLHKSANPAQSSEAWLSGRSLMDLYSGTRAYFRPVSLSDLSACLLQRDTQRPGRHGYFDRFVSLS